MVKLGDSGFDADKVEPLGTFEPMPVGEYLFTVTETRIGPSKKDPENQNLTIEFTVLDGAMKGRKIFDNLCIVHKSEKAVEMAQRKLASITRAVGLHKIGDTDELKGKPLILRVGIRKGDPASQYPDDQNDIKEYKSASGAPVCPPNSTSQAPAAAQKMPWEK
jgi:hypothetical protein